VIARHREHRFEYLPEARARPSLPAIGQCSYRDRLGDSSARHCAQSWPRPWGLYFIENTKCLWNPAGAYEHAALQICRRLCARHSL